jgi:hypothetical protein
MALASDCVDQVTCCSYGYVLLYVLGLCDVLCAAMMPP